MAVDLVLLDAALRPVEAPYLPAACAVCGGVHGIVDDCDPGTDTDEAERRAEDAADERRWRREHDD